MNKQFQREQIESWAFNHNVTWLASVIFTGIWYSWRIAVILFLVTISIFYHISRRTAELNLED